MVNKLSKRKKNDSNNKISRAHFSSHLIIYVCSIVNDMSTFVIEDHMLDWHSCQISS